MDLKMKRSARIKFIKILEKYNQTFPHSINQESVSDLKEMASLEEKKEIDAIVRLISKKEDPDEREYPPLDDEELKKLILYNLNKANFWDLLREFKMDAGLNKRLEDFKKWMEKVGIFEAYEEARVDRKTLYLVKATNFDEIEQFESLAQACDKLGLREYRTSYVGADKGISLGDDLILITQYGLKLLKGYKY